MDSPSQGPFASLTPPSPAILRDWLDLHGITTHPSLHITQMPASQGLSITSTATIPLGEILCGIPKKQILSHRTASFSAVIPPPGTFDSTAEAILYLTACLLHEFRLGEQSGLYGWLQILPRDIIPLPTFWRDEGLYGQDGKMGLDWLAGTEGGKELVRKDGEGLAFSDLREYYTLLEPLLPPTNATPQPSPFTHFLHSFSMVSTRGFVIDPYHTIGLLPFCDLFNHSSISPHTSLLADNFVCPTCGSLARCVHDGDGDGDVERFEGVSQVYLDKMEEGGMGDSVDMRVERVVIEGEEVLSCYEEGIGDGKLLVEWGFISGKKKTASLSWDARELLDGGKGRWFMGLIQRGKIEDTVRALQQGLINGKEGMRSMTIRGDGSISGGLFLCIALEVLIDDPNTDTPNLDDLEDDILALVHDLYSGAFISTSHHTRQFAEAIQHLIKRRVERMHKPKLTVSELREIHTGLDDASPLERMALEHVLSEREILEVAGDRWKSISRG